MTYTVPYMYSRSEYIILPLHCNERRLYQLQLPHILSLSHTHTPTHTHKYCCTAVCSTVVYFMVQLTFTEQ